MDFTDVTPSEIVFKQQLSCTRFSVIFLVVIRNTTCVMKVVRWWVGNVFDACAKLNSIMVVDQNNIMRTPIAKQTSTFCESTA